jgi:hypothetical protein
MLNTVWVLLEQPNLTYKLSQTKKDIVGSKIILEHNVMET